MSKNNEKVKKIIETHLKGNRITYRKFIGDCPKLNIDIQHLVKAGDNLLKEKIINFHLTDEKLGPTKMVKRENVQAKIVEALSGEESYVLSDTKSNFKIKFEFIL